MIAWGLPFSSGTASQSTLPRLMMMNANTDVDLVPDWLTRFPFDTVAYSLATPLSLHDGRRTCRYLGMVVAGTVVGDDGAPVDAEGVERGLVAPRH